MQRLNCVLLVDDDGVTNKLHELVLKRLNIADELLIATNGKIAIDIITERCEKNFGCPDLILLDINMPVMNGFEFIEVYEHLKIKNRAEAVIMLTTSSNFMDMSKAKNPYITSFLNKPLTERMIKDILIDCFQWKFPATKQ
jgi:CheY-like chemotaxis protein